MKLFKLILIVSSFLFLGINSIQAQEFNRLDYFYGDGCVHCAKISPFIEQVKHEYPNTKFIKHEIYSDNNNRVLLSKYFNHFNINNNDQGIPVVFMGEDYLIGDKPILNDLRNIIEKNKYKPSIVFNTVEEVKDEAEEKLSSLSILVVIGAAVVDSINPCAIAVLLVLLSALLITDSRKKILTFGLSFIASIYICYFLFGLGLFASLQIFNISSLFYKTIGVLALVLGILNIKDYFWYGAGGFVMEIPRSWRPTLKGLLNRVTTPLGAFFVGFVVCLFELPCTGGPYLVILGLLAEKSTRIAAMPILALYNLVFVLPLLLIVYLLYIGHTNIDKVKEWKERNVKVLHLIGGIIMFILGCLLIFSLI